MAPSSHSRFVQDLPADHNAFLYTYRGTAEVAGQGVATQRMAILGNDAAADGVVIEAPSGARVLLLAGRPLREPIHQYGPFVMNSPEQIREAIADFSLRR